MSGTRKLTIDELIEKLTAYVDDPMWADHSEMPKSLTRTSIKVINNLKERVNKLETRLEMNFAYVNGKRVPMEPGSIPDGIDCRDETIKGLDERIERITKERDLALLAARYETDVASAAVADLKSVRRAGAEAMRERAAKVREALIAAKEFVEVERELRGNNDDGVYQVRVADVLPLIESALEALNSDEATNAA